MNKVDSEIEPRAGYERKYTLKTSVDVKLKRENIQGNPGRQLGGLTLGFTQ